MCESRREKICVYASENVLSSSSGRCFGSVLITGSILGSLFVDVKD